MNIGIIGHAADKFTASMEAHTRALILNEIILDRAPYTPIGITIVSGRCPLGGVDVWAEEIANRLGMPTLIHNPANLNWSTGYKPRNLLIARNSDILHIILAEDYHSHYTGMRFDHCYHCKTDSHVKSGACWTGKQARKLGKKVIYHIIPVIE